MNVEFTFLIFHFRIIPPPLGETFQTPAPSSLISSTAVGRSQTPGRKSCEQDSWSDRSKQGLSHLAQVDAFHLLSHVWGGGTPPAPGKGYGGAPRSHFLVHNLLLLLLVQPPLLALVEPLDERPRRTQRLRAEGDRRGESGVEALRVGVRAGARPALPLPLLGRVDSRVQLRRVDRRPQFDLRVQLAPIVSCQSHLQCGERLREDR